MSDSDSPEGNSRAVTSSQKAPHARLGALVRKHLAGTGEHRIAEHTRTAFESVRDRVESDQRPLILDSFCGTGMSTAALAQQYPEAFVIGVDKSAHRLNRHEDSTDNNYVLLQADCYGFWQLAADAGWTLAAHYLFYPNPWPKPGHLQRRVQGSAAFPCLLSLGGRVELRSNWQVYVEEFGLALVVAGYHPHIDQIRPEQPISLFERKYLHSDHALWRCQCSLGDNSASTQDR